MPAKTTGRDTVRKRNKGISRRRLIKTASATAGLAVGGLPTVLAQNIKDVTLLHAGPPVTAIAQIADQATKDLGA